MSPSPSPQPAPSPGEPQPAGCTAVLNVQAAQAALCYLNSAESWRMSPMKKEGLKKLSRARRTLPIAVDSTAAWVCNKRYRPLVVVKPQYGPDSPLLCIP